MLSRRDFLSVATLAGLGLFTHRLYSADPAATSTVSWRRRLILIELNGGNDGLNTVVPYADPAYTAARKNIAVPRDQVLTLDDHLGLHPSLKPLMDLWSAQELAVVLGVGYPRPNRSHFRSIDIWNTASDSDEVLDDGWLARAYAGCTAPAELVAHGIVLGRPDSDPLRGPGCRSLAMESPAQFIARSQRFATAPEAAATPALAQVLRVQGDIISAREHLKKRMGSATVTTEFPKHRFGQQCAQAAQVIAADVEVPVLKLSHSGFDTHSNQRDRHPRLLAELAEGITALRTALQTANAWDRTLIVTYSEFGRRVSENASGGTDHGTAAPQFILGGGVRGGLYGVQPSLTDLDHGDLRFTTDFRRSYATINQWLGLPTGSTNVPALDCLRV